MRDPKGKALKGIDVMAFYRTGQTSWANSEFHTNASGRYEIRNACLDSGSAATVARESSWYLEASRDFKVLPGRNVINFTVKPAAQIRYRVINSGGQRTPNVRLTSLATGEDVIDFPVGSGADWMDLKVKPGRYRVSVSGKKGGAMKFLSAKRVTVNAKASKRVKATFKINKGGTIKGSLSPAPLFKSRCFSYGYVSVGSAQGWTDWVRPSKSGTFTIRNLPPGKYQVHLAAEYRGGLRSDYYRGGTSRVKTVTVKSGKTTSLKKTKLANKRIGDSFEWLVWTAACPED